MTFQTPMPPRIIAPGGPVSVALRSLHDAHARTDMADALAALRLDDPEADRFPQLLALREALAADIEERIAILDALDGDCDLEDGTDAEATAAEWLGRGAHRYNIGEAA